MNFVGLKLKLGIVVLLVTIALNFIVIFGAGSTNVKDYCKVTFEKTTFQGSFYEENKIPFELNIDDSVKSITLQVESEDKNVVPENKKNLSITTDRTTEKSNQLEIKNTKGIISGYIYINVSESYLKENNTGSSKISLITKNEKNQKTQWNINVLFAKRNITYSTSQMQTSEPINSESAKVVSIGYVWSSKVDTSLETSSKASSLTPVASSGTKGNLRTFDNLFGIASLLYSMLTVLLGLMLSYLLLILFGFFGVKNHNKNGDNNKNSNKDIISTSNSCNNVDSNEVKDKSSTNTSSDIKISYTMKSTYNSLNDTNQNIETNLKPVVQYNYINLSTTKPISHGQKQTETKYTFTSYFAFIISWFVSTPKPGTIKNPVNKQQIPPPPQPPIQENNCDNTTTKTTTTTQTTKTTTQTTTQTTEPTTTNTNTSTTTNTTNNTITNTTQPNTNTTTQTIQPTTNTTTQTTTQPTTSTTTNTSTQPNTSTTTTSQPTTSTTNQTTQPTTSTTTQITTIPTPNTTTQTTQPTTNNTTQIAPPPPQPPSQQNTRNQLTPQTTTQPSTNTTTNSTTQPSTNTTSQTTQPTTNTTTNSTTQPSTNTTSQTTPNTTTTNSTTNSTTQPKTNTTSETTQPITKTTQTTQTTKTTQTIEKHVSIGDGYSPNQEYDNKVFEEITGYDFVEEDNLSGINNKLALTTPSGSDFGSKFNSNGTNLDSHGTHLNTDGSYEGDQLLNDGNSNRNRHISYKSSENIPSNNINGNGTSSVEIKSGSIGSVNTNVQTNSTGNSSSVFGFFGWLFEKLYAMLMSIISFLIGLLSILYYKITGKSCF